jgi:peptidoglycan/LPS O-acetylase OafA/YrhL
LWLHQLTHHQYGGPIFSLRPFSTESGLVDLDLLTKLLASLLALELLRKYDAVVRDWFRHLGETSFGIFFVHGPVLALLQALARRRMSGSSHYGVGVWLLGTVAVISISMGSIRLVRRLLGHHSRYVIGC